MDADTRRRPPARDLDLSSNEELVALIVDEIRRHGPITFARFMELALYAPELGYYTSPPTRIGRAGDFLTAPETHPIFGAAIARHVAAVWTRLGRPAGFTVREYGAGTGALAASIASALAADEPDLASLLRYEAVEINPYRRDDLASRPALAALTAMDPESAAAAPPVAAGFVLANEFFDAFPVHRIRQTSEGLQEFYVHVSASPGAATPFDVRLGSPSTTALEKRLSTEGVQLQPDQHAEIALGLDEWFTGVGAWLQTGVVVVIDYGDRAPELYGPRRHAGTLLGYVDHRVIDDPLVAVGRQDLTAHVDFTAVEAAATAADFSTLSFTTQSAYLVDLGLEELLERARSDPAQRLGEYLDLRSGVVRLLDPRHTGGFRVLVLGRGLGDDETAQGV